MNMKIGEMNDETGALIMSSQPKPKDATQALNEAHVRIRTPSAAARVGGGDSRAEGGDE